MTLTPAPYSFLLHFSFAFVLVLDDGLPPKRAPHSIWPFESLLPGLPPTPPPLQTGPMRPNALCTSSTQGVTLQVTDRSLWPINCLDMTDVVRRKSGADFNIIFTTRGAVTKWRAPSDSAHQICLPTSSEHVLIVVWVKKETAPCLSFPLIPHISPDLMCGCDHHCGVPARPSVPLTPTSYSFLSTFHLPAFSMVCHLLQLLTDVIDSILARLH